VDEEHADYKQKHADMNEEAEQEAYVSAPIEIVVL